MSRCIIFMNKIDPMFQRITRLLLIFAFLLSFSQSKCRAQAATFTIEYGGFTTEAEAAFQYAADIWSNYLISAVPIKVQVNMVILLPGQLGITFPNGELNFPGAPLANAWYASSLANAISGTELNPGEVDMEIFLNNSANWYFGTDGNPGPGQYDFVSTVLHEMCHGLGFLSLANMDGTDGSFGLIDASAFSPLVTSFPWPELDTLPGVFDLFLENNAGTSLMSYTNPSAEIGTQITSANIYFNSPSVLEDNGGLRGRIYAPPTFTLGSSMSHWDEGFYPVGNENELMTPNAAAAHSNHDPGPLTLAVLDDIGWEINYDTANVAIHQSFHPAIKIFPDPADNFIVVSGTTDNFSCSVFDASGKLYLTKQLIGSQPLLDVSGLPPGIYFIRISDNGKIISASFMKN